MATELGATEIHAFPAQRSVATGLHPERWEKILVGAAGQSGRATPPALLAHASLQEALAGLPNLPRLVLVPGADPIVPPGRSVVLLLGPEGGLTLEEIELAQLAGFQPAGLGPWILRADTAAAAALARF